MKSSLSGRSFLVTGGGSGLGFGCALELLKDDAYVTICGRTAETLQNAVKRLVDETGASERVQYVVGDVTQDADVAKIAEKAAAYTGKLNGCIANAGGGGAYNYLHEQDTDELRRVLELNIISTQLCIKHTVPLIQKAGGGSFVGMSSLMGHPAMSAIFMGGYGIAKAGIDQMMRIAAWEYGDQKIRFNSIRPGFIETEIHKQYVPEGSPLRQQYRDHILLSGPLGQPEDIGHMARFLMGDEARWITGQAISVDGGQSLFGVDSSIMMPNNKIADTRFDKSKS